MTIKTFRGLMTDGDQVKLRLKTMTGSQGYRIVRFQLMAFAPGADNYEAIVKIYKLEQASATATIDFSDNTLLGAGFFTGDTTQQTMKWGTTIIETEVFNQDIYITYNDLQGSDAQMNFHLELEVVDLRDNENEYITLRDIKATLPQHG